MNPGADAPVGQVEDKVYKVPRHGFIWNSDVFKNMFELPQYGDHTEGQFDDNPIALPSCTKSEFESLLEVLYPSPYVEQQSIFLNSTDMWTSRGSNLYHRQFLPTSVLSKYEWGSVLKLSTLWEMQQVRRRVVASIPSDSHRN